jgi:hypothetical protein
LRECVKAESAEEYNETEEDGFFHSNLGLPKLEKVRAGYGNGSRGVGEGRSTTKDTKEQEGYRSACFPAVVSWWIGLTYSWTFLNNSSNSIFIHPPKK